MIASFRLVQKEFAPDNGAVWLMQNPSSNAFSSWSATHFAAVVTILLLVAATVAAGRLVHNGQKLRAFRLVLAGIFAVALLAGTVRHATVGFSNWADLLPLHLCDVSLIMAIIALATLRRLPFEFAYFFGIGGTLQALLTPDLVADFPTFEYFAFFAAHGATLVAVACLMAGYRLHPQPGAILRMVYAGNAYVVLAAVVNILTGANFGYLRSKPEGGSLLDHLGPWPWYILSIELIGFMTVLILDLPFLWQRRRSRKRGDRS